MSPNETPPLYHPSVVQLPGASRSPAQPRTAPHSPAQPRTAPHKGLSPRASPELLQYRVTLPRRSCSSRPAEGRCSSRPAEGRWSLCWWGREHPVAAHTTRAAAAASDSGRGSSSDGGGGCLLLKSSRRPNLGAWRAHTPHVLCQQACHRVDLARQPGLRKLGPPALVQLLSQALLFHLARCIPASRPVLRHPMTK